ncbi:hypothetical protein LEP1GSC170_4932 [Leptospira interrogans serovar Bataviae str. HAI135]|nr:hypothetical protein LEP1GSC170_4932 [Leptospira interrogans serovar Bataviae str. HAI135]
MGILCNSSFSRNTQLSVSPSSFRFRFQTFESSLFPKGVSKRIQPLLVFVF